MLRSGIFHWGGGASPSDDVWGVQGRCWVPAYV